MATAKYQKQEVIDACIRAIDREQAEISSSENDMKNRLTELAARRGFWSGLFGGRARGEYFDSYAEIVRIHTMRRSVAELKSIKRLAETTDGETVTLTADEANLLF